MELVPHITLNPSFNIDMLEYLEPSSSSAGGSIANAQAIIDIVLRQEQVRTQAGLSCTRLRITKV